jgi:hypothetical protein
VASTEMLSTVSERRERDKNAARPLLVKRKRFRKALGQEKRMTTVPLNQRLAVSRKPAEASVALHVVDVE